MRGFAALSSAIADAARDYSRAAERVARSFQQALLERAAPATCTTWSTARRRPVPTVDAATPAAPEPDLRGVAAASRCSTTSTRAAVVDACARELLDAGRPAQPRPRRSALHRPLWRRSARARRRLSPGHGVELAARPVRAGALPRLSATRAAARRLLDGLAAHLREACVGQISEIFDGDAPHRPARLLRAGVERRRNPARLERTR